MKSTGIVRRIDDLGRVVIPKDLRRTLHIREGDPLELFVEGEYVCFRKYNTTELFAEALEDLADLMQDKELSDCLEEEEKALIESTIDFLKKKWNDKKVKESAT